MTYPLNDDAFDDRLAITGTSGSGKTYMVLGAMARLHKRGARYIGFDALGVMWGIRALADGVSPSAFKPVIFGGPHGDLPLTVAGAAIMGEAVAGMAESVILDLSTLGSKAMERRFMLAFLTALERHANREPVHLLIDEADLWAPQRILDKEGDAMKLLGKVDNIVRRGRVKGFIPWLITQRPAVLSKDVLSQADGVIAMKLTGSHDRDAIGAWIEGAADRAKGKEILALLPTLTTGEGVIWNPGRQVLKTAKFPANSTFDSSRTPKRGESVRKVNLKPLDLDKLKGKLATVQEEAAANDPAALKTALSKAMADLAKAQRAKTAPPAPVAAADPKALAAAQSAGFDAGWRVGHQKGFDLGAKAAQSLVRSSLGAVPYDLPAPGDRPKPPKGVAIPTVIMASPAMKAELAKPKPRIPVLFPGSHITTGSQAELLRVLAWWESMGKPNPTRAQVCAVAGWKVTSGHIKNLAGSLKSAGLVEYPSGGTLALTDEGRSVAPPPGAMSILDGLHGVLSGPQRQVMDLLLEEGGAMTREAICTALNWEPTSGHIKNILGSMKTLEVLTYPSPGSAALADWVK